MKQETLEEAIKEHLYANAFAADPDNPGFVDRFIEHTKAAEWGAEWRINSVWHDASEAPQYSGMLIALNKKGLPFICGPNHSDWKTTVKIFHIERWAYVKDLIPNTEE